MTFFQCPLLFGCVYDAQIIDAGIRLGGLPGAHKVGNRDGCQQADNGHDNHDFNKCKAGFKFNFYFNGPFHYLTVQSSRRIVSSGVLWSIDRLPRPNLQQTEQKQCRFVLFYLVHQNKIFSNNQPRILDQQHALLFECKDIYSMEDLVSFYAALADENRLRLLNLIKDGEICVCYLQGVLQTNQPKISRHLAYLRLA